MNGKNFFTSAEKPSFRLNISARPIASSAIDLAHEYKPQLASDTDPGFKATLKHRQKTSQFGVDGQPTLLQPLRKHLPRLRAGLATVAR